MKFSYLKGRRVSSLSYCYLSKVGAQFVHFILHHYSQNLDVLSNLYGSDDGL